MDEDTEAARVRLNVGRAAKLLMQATLTTKQWLETVRHFGERCAYCGTAAFEVMDHFVPLVFGGGTTADNCVPACRRCNGMKSDRAPFPSEWDGPIGQYLRARTPEVPPWRHNPAVRAYRWSDIRHRRGARDREAMTPRCLREALGLTQIEVAGRMGLAPSELPQIEGRDDHQLSTLRRYVEALGGELEVVAVLGGKRVVLSGV
jgi:hypothetical protein